MYVRRCRYIYLRLSDVLRRRAKVTSDWSPIKVSLSPTDFSPFYRRARAWGWERQRNSRDALPSHFRCRVQRSMMATTFGNFCIIFSCGPPTKAWDGETLIFFVLPPPQTHAYDGVPVLSQKITWVRLFSARDLVLAYFFFLLIV